MRILHTADWHVGKKLGRVDRSEEAEAVLAELVAVAGEVQPDVVLVAGDLFDRSLPPFASLRSVLGALVGLASTGAHVVAIPGNHDSADLFEVLAPYVTASGITLVPKTKRPEEGGVIEVTSRDGKETARIACFPFLHEANIVDFMETSEARHKSYADRVRDICSHYARWMEAHPTKNAVDILLGHFMVHGAVVSGSERELHIGEAYTATQEAVPHQFHYVALGHIHKPQPVPGSEDYSEYCGSLMQLDFGDAGQDKSLVVADVSSAGKRKIERHTITSGRKLLKLRGTLDELRERAPEVEGAILDVEVLTDGPAAGIADEIRSFLPDALYVRTEYPREEFTASAREGLSLVDLYEEYVKQKHKAPPGDELMNAFRELVEEVGAAL